MSANIETHRLSLSPEAAERFVMSLAQANIEAGGKPEMFVTMGSTGAGKSWFLSNMWTPTAGSFSLCPDAFKWLREDFDPKAPWLVHDWSSDLRTRVNAAVTEAGAGRWIWDGTCSKPQKARARFAAWRAAGFDVHLRFIDVPKALAVERDAKRSRTLGAEFVSDVWDKVQAAWPALRDDPNLASVGRWWNVPGESKWLVTP